MHFKLIKPYSAPIFIVINIVTVIIFYYFFWHWSNANREDDTPDNYYEKEIFYYNRGYKFNDSKTDNLLNLTDKHSLEFYKYIKNIFDRKEIDVKINKKNVDAKNQPEIVTVITINQESSLEIAKDHSPTDVQKQYEQSFLYKFNKPRFAHFEKKLRAKRQIKNADSNIVLIKHKRPRFLNLETPILEMDNIEYQCTNRLVVNCTEKTTEFKQKLLMELQRILMKESGVFKSKSKVKNPYNVKYLGKKTNFMNKTINNILCEMKNKIHVNNLVKNDFVRGNSFKRFLPKHDMFHNKNYNTCAIIASAGSLLDSNLGEFIDSHDFVLRFNDAPIDGYEKDVGTKTSIRILNSQVVAKHKFNFTTSDLYKNVTLLIWDPSNYTSTIEDWFLKPDYNFFPNFIKFKQTNPKLKLFVLNPKSLWSIWNFLQSNFHTKLRSNPPSSGFLALSYLLNTCSYVDLIEYIPSTRLTKRCHYYDKINDTACTFGTWHPLSAEKLLSYKLNQFDDFQVFQMGSMRIKGFSNLKC